MIDNVVAALGLGLNLTDEEIADVLWLAVQMQQFGDGVISEQSDRNEALENSVSNRESPKQPAQPLRDADRDRQDENKKDEQNFEVHSKNAQGDDRSARRSDELQLKIPDARSLQKPLDLARSLRPLMRRVPSQVNTLLDEEATVRRIAEEKIWCPVLRPALEPWLDLALVIDDSASMLMWRHTITELQHFLSSYGVFRDVRVWRLGTDKAEKVCIYAGATASDRNGSPRSPSELIEANGRGLVLVVSDCIAPIWRNGAIANALQIWSRSGMAAILQMLPNWLWGRTALGRGVAAQFSALAAGIPNYQLTTKTVSTWYDIDLATSIKIPVVTLEPEKFTAWAEMLAGKGGAWSAGIVFEPELFAVPEVAIEFDGASVLDAEDRVQSFRLTASPIARRLAGLLAAAPVISLPIVRILQSKVLDKAQPVHVAEVFLGGLLKPLSEITAKTNPNYVQYDFIEGVRDLLLKSVPSSEIVNIVAEVSEFVANRLGVSLEEFAAVIRNPRQVENTELVNQTRPFALLTAKILKRLGGEYLGFAEEVEQANINLIQRSTTVKPSNFSIDSQGENIWAGSLINLPQSDVTFFAGRDDDLKKVHELLQQNQRVAVATFIKGMGGIGKSELALQYGLRHLLYYGGGICWLRANEGNLPTQLQDFVLVELGEMMPDGLDSGEKLARYCWARLSARMKSPMLVVLDDVKDYAKVEPFLPPLDGKFRVLATTRLGLGNAMQQYTLDVLALAAAVDLLRSFLPEADPRRGSEAAIEQLCEWLGRLPLAINLVGRYLSSKPDLSIAKMQERLETKKLQQDALTDKQSALSEYVEALEIYRELAKQNPATFLPDVAMALNNLGLLHQNTSEMEIALSEYIEALEIYRELAKQNPATFLPDVAMTLNNLGLLHQNTSEMAIALSEYIEALEIYRELAKQNPATFLPEVAMTLKNLANLHSDTNEMAIALSEYTEALEIYRELAKQNPATFLPEVATTLKNLANLHSDTIDNRNITINQENIINIHAGSSDTKSPSKIAELSQINDGVGLKRSRQNSVNPFQYRASVSPDRFYGQVSAIADVKNRIGASSAQCVNIVGLRRSGKSSFLRYIKERPQVFFQDSQQPLIVLLDLQDARFHEPSGIMEGLRQNLRRQIGTEPWANADNDDPYAIESALLALKDRGYRLIVMLDDLEQIGVRLDKFQDWGEDWRSKAGAGLFSLVVASRHPLSEIYKNWGVTSPFEHIFSMTVLGALEIEAWEKLLRDGLSSCGTDTLKLIDNLAGRLPFYTQMAAALVWQHGDVEVVKKEFLFQVHSHWAGIYYDLSDLERNALKVAAGKSGRAASRERRERLQRYGLLGTNGELFSNEFAEFVRGLR